MIRPFKCSCSDAGHNVGWKLMTAVMEEMCRSEDEGQWRTALSGSNHKTKHVIFDTAKIKDLSQLVKSLKGNLECKDVTVINVSRHGKKMYMC